MLLRRSQHNEVAVRNALVDSGNLICAELARDDSHSSCITYTIINVTDASQVQAFPDAARHDSVTCICRRSHFQGSFRDLIAAMDTNNVSSLHKLEVSEVTLDVCDVLKCYPQIPYTPPDNGRRPDAAPDQRRPHEALGTCVQALRPKDHDHRPDRR